MRHTLIVFLLINLILSACAPASTPTPNLAPSATPLPTATAAPTSTATPTATPTPTPVPTIQVGSLSVPDPRVTNPELFDLRNPSSPIVQFAHAFGVKPEEVGDLTPKVLTGIDGKPFVVLTTADLPQTANFDESGIPLLIAEQGKDGEWIWRNLNSKIAADKANLNLGVLVGLYPGSPDFNKLQQIQKNYFNSALINVNWSNLQPNNEKIDYQASGVDWSVNFAQRNMKGGLSLGLSLVWAADAPAWLKNGNFSRDELIHIMADHIKEVMTRYKEKVGAWVVVNEPYLPPYRTDDVFYKVIGSDYIEIAFKAAREADPSATLIYNDTSNDVSNGLTTGHTKTIVNDLKSKGLIDAVGLQMHLDGAKPPDKQDLIATMRSYGVPVFITEFDVNMKDVRGTPEERAQKQAEIYSTVVEAAIESGVCNDIFVFQVGDKYSVWENFPGYGYSPQADPTPFDDSFQPKPAYYALVKAILDTSKP
ncbi:endo-1,4-beta-xylanase [Vibrio sp.]|uniref:endo-1,4-beta-xylanase n=1 Tax=Vibrio sp. TaxID=678 RepID=UPI003D0A602B